MGFFNARFRRPFDGDVQCLASSLVSMLGDAWIVNTDDYDARRRSAQEIFSRAPGDPAPVLASLDSASKAVGLTVRLLVKLDDTNDAVGTISASGMLVSLDGSFPASIAANMLKSLNALGLEPDGEWS